MIPIRIPRAPPPGTEGRWSAGTQRLYLVKSSQVIPWAEGENLREGEGRGYFGEGVLLDGGVAVADLVTVAWVFT